MKLRFRQPPAHPDDGVDETVVTVARPELQRHAADLGSALCLPEVRDGDGGDTVDGGCIGLEHAAGPDILKSESGTELFNRVRDAVPQCVVLGRYR